MEGIYGGGITPNTLIYYGIGISLVIRLFYKVFKGMESFFLVRRFM
jgi:hypothetical protein